MITRTTPPFPTGYTHCMLAHLFPLSGMATCDEIHNKSNQIHYADTKNYNVY